MRRQGGHYGGDSGGSGAAASAEKHRQQQNSKSVYYQEQQPLGEKEGALHQNQWRWERDGAQAKLSQSAMSPTALGPGREAPRSYYQNQRLDPRMPLEKQGGGNLRSNPHEEDMDTGYEDKQVVQTFEGLEQRFLDDIMKLSKEQTDAEDVEIARHRERVNAISAQYEDQLIALRAQQASRREEFFQRESQVRQQQYKQVAMEQYPTSRVSPNDPRGYNSGPSPSEEPNRAYNSDNYDSYRERGRFPGNARDHGYDPKDSYSRSRAYDTGSRYY